MKKYHFMRIISSTFIIAYAFLLLPITRGKQPLAENNPILLFSAIIIGTISSIFMFKETIEKQYKKEKTEKDERYFKNRNTFSFYFVIVLAIILPIFMIIVSTQHHLQISLSSLAIGYFVISFFYMICLEIIQRKA
ncbi:2'-O-methyl transferase [Listeria ivanovii]|uniref:2'-O-methyl transferase n=1 Tax=Listeria ivanovii TaxID=1638 RepID=UPI000DA79864|nr:2'-O-methyl transferase [Listeria ivanovii]PZF88749.1 2'-O-methyl transferase [Listeria ivanovii]PZF93900.1 2'-O-methyl transferase [Listeria ivanovii]PZG04726.1 2'-O-methyl transferase [Listeria ivanovii]PZG09130.1 2'-O-methyl transferase [Listeria ivanovii]PZG26074.1 2'-O-methyl transferase [Listeria ivanovii]